LELCVTSVQKAIQNIDAEIIVIDNDSQDDSCEMMKQRFPEVKLIENKENLFVYSIQIQLLQKILLRKP
jgi:GT2 family glycosyltransferase